VGRRFKIGITTDLKKRLYSIKSTSKQDVILLQSSSSNLFDVYKMEQFILYTYKDYRILRPWTTELFEVDVLQQHNTSLEQIKVEAIYNFHLTHETNTMH
jgi:hypothetical protein